MNPFSGTTFQNFCQKQAADCPHFDGKPSFLNFRHTPPVPAADQAEGSLLLVGGRFGQGKTVFAHRLLHDYHRAGYQAIDLMRGLGSRTDLTDPYRNQVISSLHGELCDLSEDEPPGLPSESEMWEIRLQELLSGHPCKLVIRLPAVRQTPDVTAEAIAEDAARYALAAGQTRSIFIWEHRCDNWPAGWRDLQRVLGTQNTGTRFLQLRQISVDDLWVYGTKLVEQFSGAPLLPPALKLTLHRVLSGLEEPPNLIWFHRFMEAAFTDAEAFPPDPPADGPLPPRHITESNLLTAAFNVHYP